MSPMPNPFSAGKFQNSVAVVNPNRRFHSLGDARANIPMITRWKVSIAMIAMMVTVRFVENSSTNAPPHSSMLPPMWAKKLVRCDGRRSSGKLRYIFRLKRLDTTMGALLNIGETTLLKW